MNHSNVPIIFDIKRYSIKDGPGIRVTLFFKGCPLSCVWCHNPEGISPKNEKLYTIGRCIACDSCVDVCDVGAITKGENGLIFNNQKCIVCGKCADACPSKALEMAGRRYTIAELVEIIEGEQLFFDSSDEGGVTICGGEPFMHTTYLVELLKACKESGIHTVVDTTLYTSRENIDKVMEYTDLFLVDLKSTNDEIHKEFTGVSNRRILENISYIASRGADFRVRIPLIEGVNCDDANIEESGRFLSSIGWRGKCVDLLAYHDIGKTKHVRRGTIYNSDEKSLSKPSDERIAEITARLVSYGLDAKL